MMHHSLPAAPELPMRTTFTLDDDAAALAKTYARANDMRLSQAVSELIRRASAPPKLQLKKKGELWVLPATPGAPKLSAKQIKDMIDELD
jgi:hypothetical protein